MYDNSLTNKIDHVIGTILFSLVFIVTMFLTYAFTPVYSYGEMSLPKNTNVEISQNHLKYTLIGETNTFYFDVSGTDTHNIVFQRLDNVGANSQWVNVYENDVELGSDDSTQRIGFDVQSLDRSGEVKYRWIVDGSQKESFLIHNVDTSVQYSDEAKFASQVVSDYCSDVYISYGDSYINNLPVDENGGTIVGLAKLEENTILIRSPMKNDDLDWVIRHECGHILQYDAYQFTSYDINEDLDMYYQNENNTSMEKNADCIAYLIGDEIDELLDECPGNRAQSAFNIVQGKQGSSVELFQNFENNLLLKNTGFAVSSFSCDESSKTCSQKFENGTAYYNGDDEDNPITFVSSDKTVNENTRWVKLFLTLQDDD